MFKTNLIKLYFPLQVNLFIIHPYYFTNVFYVNHSVTLLVPSQIGKSLLHLQFPQEFLSVLEEKPERSCELS